ncbi:hypothetical protein V9K67_09905 [Paraflavisolibacter sp. H34]|uniref:hypothetical protein n=1 Tax=Huijunlia imazamoxiresistens TaxID=3127457 RepID=UPI003018D0AC
MKKLFVFLFTTALLVSSCKKDNGNNNPAGQNDLPAATFSYKVNGTLIECNGSLAENSREGSLIRKEQTLTSSGSVETNRNYIFSIHATRNYFFGDAGEPILEIELNTPSLSVATYTHTNDGILYVKTFYPNQSEFCAGCTPTVYGGQEFSVSITKLENGYADGTFSGKLVRRTSGFDLVTEGQFRNVKVLQ